MRDHEPERGQAGTLLRIGVLLDSLVVPSWVAAMIEEIIDSSIARIELVLLNAEPRRVHGVWKSYGVGLHTLRLDRLYMYLEDRLFSTTSDAMQPYDLAPLLESVAQLTVAPNDVGGEFDLDDETLRLVESHQLDVALLFGFGLPARRMLRISRYGIWSHREFEAAMADASHPGLEEVLKESPTTESRLVARAQNIEHAVELYRSFGSTDIRLAKRSRNAMLWKSSQFVVRKLRELARTMPESIADLRVSDREVPPERRLSNLQMARCAASSVVRFVRDRRRHRASMDQWIMAYRLPGEGNGFPGDLSEYRMLFPPAGRTWADPFPYQRDGRHFLFFEEQDLPLGNGRICVVEVDNSGMVERPTPVLERDYHLSYPFLFEWDSEFYMIPETAKARRIELYRCAAFPHRWRFDRVLLPDVNAVDTTLVERDGTWWMFTTMSREEVWNVEELHLFHSESPFGPWTAHVANPVVSDVRSARPAGNLFTRDGMLCRPAQDCSRGYGSAVRVMEIVELSRERYVERQVDFITPDPLGVALGVHTINEYRGLAAIDLKRRTRRRPTTVS